jgi:hypothetical protein
MPPRLYRSLVGVTLTGARVCPGLVVDGRGRLSAIVWLKKREAVPKNTPTYAFNQNPGNVTEGERTEETSNLQHWFGGQRSLEISEDIIGLGRYGKTSIIESFASTHWHPLTVCT